MRIIYHLPIKQGIKFSVPSLKPSIKIDDVQISWEVDNEGHLLFFKLGISGVKPRLNSEGAISSSYPEIKGKAFSVATYIANRFLCQTIVDAIDIEQIFSGSPETILETPDEEQKFSCHQRELWNEVSLLYDIQGSFKPDNYSAEYIHSIAFSFYADGLRVMHPFVRYELFFKVIEYFFPFEGEKFDARVSKYALRYDKRFDSCQIEELRNTRNRIMHPKANKGHLNPSDIDAVKEVRSYLDVLHDLVKILLEHPPS
jgi:hypothetical protein